MSRAAALAAVARYFDSGQFETELADLVRHPTESQDPDAAPHLQAYLEQAIPQVLDGTINPGLVFDRVLPLDQTAEGYRLMDDREALKVMIRP